MPANGIAQPSLAHQIYRTVQDFLKIFLHRLEIQEAELSVWRKRDQDVHIALRGEVVPQYRPEEGQLVDPPPMAEILDKVERKWNASLGWHLQGHDGLSLSSLSSGRSLP